MLSAAWYVNGASANASVLKVATLLTKAPFMVHMTYWQEQM